MVERLCDADHSTGPAGELHGTVGFFPHNALFLTQPKSDVEKCTWRCKHAQTLRWFWGSGHWNNNREVIDGNHLVAQSCWGCNFKNNCFCIYKDLDGPSAVPQFRTRVNENQKAIITAKCRSCHMRFKYVTIWFTTKNKSALSSVRLSFWLHLNISMPTCQY